MLEPLRPDRTSTDVHSIEPPAADELAGNELADNGPADNEPVACVNSVPHREFGEKDAESVSRNRIFLPDPYLSDSLR